LTDDDLIDIADLEVVKKSGKTYIRLSSISKNREVEEVDDTLPQDVKDMLGGRDDI